MDGLVNLDYAARSRVIHEALEMEDEYGWKSLDEHRDLLARLARAGWADLHGVGPRNEGERVLNGVY